MADKMLKIELKKSLIGRGAKQIATAEALGPEEAGRRLPVQPGTNAASSRARYAKHRLPAQRHRSLNQGGYA